MLRIGVNALYLIPGSVGGTEIYLRNRLAAIIAFLSKFYAELTLIALGQKPNWGLPPDEYFIIAFENHLERTPDVLFVIDNEDAFHASSTPSAAPRRTPPLPVRSPPA